MNVDPLADFVCTSRACSTALLTPEQKEVVATTATATSAATTLVVGTAVATAGAAAAVPLAFALQKAVLFTNIGGAPANPMLSGVAENLQWTQGRFGIFPRGPRDSAGELPL
jgi:hypothetical protein